ncbi:putative circadian clock protein, KaiC [Chthoniobacter flavus Ellin428]|uniref:non-specific serine/threonine protein kinase n=1 Tax=Chthoniobacter flavus Ellin428 TaxID=497964 RepID=B4D0L6_9BACT|nr:ATPase domain-containing protein [Chthoniobacter flavus]EDY19878.1 putative circadian clock protein, KaiC [Chthoniobacter flavus Ellin428]TCO91851.1 circadian clock protein KaiC [Chthoniobacter flavus]
MSAASFTPCLTGIEGLDHVLAGGLPPNRFYLILGDPGVGKTTLSIQFLLEGKRQGERTLYVTLSETRDELTEVARSHGWSLEGIDIVELSAIAQQLTEDSESTLFHPSEIELNEITRVILDEVERVQPQRVVLDSLSELRLLAGSALRYRRQLLALKQFFSGRKTTVLLLDDGVDVARDLEAQSIAHGVVTLQNLAPDYGAERRRLRILKLRGVNFRGGYHDYLIRPGGIEVFPRLVAAEDRKPSHQGRLTSGVAGLDSLLGGGLDAGTSNLLIGPAGTGKSVIATIYALAAAKRGERVEIFSFDETRALFLARAAFVGTDLTTYIENGTIRVTQIDPAEVSPGELAHRVRNQVREGVRLVIIDSLNGYLAAMPEEHHLTLHLHELCSFCSAHSATMLMLGEQTGLIGHMQMPIDLTYLADTVILLRHFEAQGELRQAISVMKKRSGAHERFIREMSVSQHGVRVGEPLSDFHGVLSGTPFFHGDPSKMINKRDG